MIEMSNVVVVCEVVVARIGEGGRVVMDRRVSGGRERPVGGVREIPLHSSVGTESLVTHGKCKEDESNEGWRV